ncbi:hypothetical protein MJG53_016748 [Ovis ammon polii x Ovis aries]|uniref:Uncharacterized protein n=1 Tax=Ovis ammon polii x Ovis aries TaxID=2918886 RepID=A0ACB9U9S5_9CETA|nr:hypothetical protein MJG53_016748 [Ovis ammon polii x Ovis aries]
MDTSNLIPLMERNFWLEDLIMLSNKTVLLARNSDTILVESWDKISHVIHVKILIHSPINGLTEPEHLHFRKSRANVCLCPTGHHVWVHSVLVYLLEHFFLSGHFPDAAGLCSSKTLACKNPDMNPPSSYKISGAHLLFGSSVSAFSHAGADGVMSYFVDSAVSGPATYSAARPAVLRQGPLNSYEDPRMACGFQSAYHPPRACYPFWEETATQEVPTGLEHYGSEQWPLLLCSMYPGSSFVFPPFHRVDVHLPGPNLPVLGSELEGRLYSPGCVLSSLLDFYEKSFRNVTLLG